MDYISTNEVFNTFIPTLKREKRSSNSLNFNFLFFEGDINNFAVVI